MGDIPTFPDPAAVVDALKQTPGCLGAELARKDNGVTLLFAWFENKQGLLNWYNSEAHRQRMKSYFGLEPSHPVQSVPDNGGAILAIASFTMADQTHFTETRLALSQLAIEFYQPIGGGIAAGGRFAPEALKVPNLREYQPKEK